jgi:hypothetical protein
MSEIRANSITVAAGNSAPIFPNGLSGSGASLTSLPAGQLTGTLPALNGSALTNLPAPTSAQVGTATAGLAAGEVGSYAFLSRVTLAAITAGSTYAGSGLRYSAALTASLSSDTNANANTNGGATPSGTWQALGSGGSASRYPITLFLRIS